MRIRSDGSVARWCATTVAAVSALLLLLAAPARAQEPTPAITINQLDASDYPELTAVVTVLDAGGSPAAGLTAASFTASDGADPVEILDAERVLDTSLNLGVVLVIDVSGSMEGAPLESAKAAATEFVEQLEPGDRATVIAFSDGVRTVVQYTSDRAALAAGITGLTAGGSTSLYEAVQASAFAAGVSLTPRTAIVVLSDGENDTTTSTATDAGSLAAIGSLAVPVYAIGYGGGADLAYLGRLAETTGGRYFGAGEADVGAVYGSIADQLRGQYALTLRATAPEDGGEGALLLTADVGGVRVSSTATAFTKGEAPPPEPTVPAPTPVETGTADEGSMTLLIVLATIVGVTIIGGGMLLAARAVVARKRQQKRERHAGLQTDAPLPAPLPGIAPVHVEEQPARLIVLTGEREGEAVKIGPVPIVIGSDPTADVRVEPSPVVAPRHANVWTREGKVMLRHTGGQKKTMMQGRPVDWLILEDGDEFSVGPHRYRIAMGRNGDAPSEAR